MNGALRGGRFVVQTAVVIGILAGLLARPAGAQTADAYQVLSLVNATRGSVGAPPVTVDATLSGVAQAWAGVMAGAGSLSHNPALGGQISGWTALAENIGMGGSIDIVHQVLVGSPSHYANMTDPRFTAAGAGAVTSGGRVFVVQVFMQGQASASAPEPPPPPPPEPAPPAPAPPEPEPVPVVVAPAPRLAVPAAVAVAVPPPVPEPPPPIIPVPVAPTEPSAWLGLVLTQLQAFDRALG